MGNYNSILNAIKKLRFLYLFLITCLGEEGSSRDGKGALILRKIEEREIKVE